MHLLSWNVQWCRGMDGRVDPARIAAEIRRLGEPDVICLQEVAANLPRLEGNDARDQAHELAHLFPAHTACFVSGVDIPSSGGRRGYFGNLLLSRLPVGRILRHSLPWARAAEAPTLPRVAIEAELEAPWGRLRVATTHLESKSAADRAAQVARLLEIASETPQAAILCGDFNLRPDDPLHAQLKTRFVDAWEAAHPGLAHAPTFRKEAPVCVDYAFVTPDLAPRIADVRVDAQTRASDHQPVMVELR